MEKITKSAEETIVFGESLGKQFSGGEIIALFGNLGAGKTTFVQGLAKGLGISDYVTSPSFVIISEFKGKLELYHIDLYRLEDESQMEDLGIEEYFSRSEGVCVMEWADKLGSLLPSNVVSIRIDPISDNERKFTITGLNK